MSTSQQGLNKEFLAERDLRIFKMRQSGIQQSEIARRFNMTPTAVGNAIRRQLQKMNTNAKRLAITRCKRVTLNGNNLNTLINYCIQYCKRNH